MAHRAGGRGEQKKIGPGDMLCGYRVLSVLGTGSFGAVYEVSKDGRTYALKISKTSSAVTGGGGETKKGPQEGDGIDTGLLLEAAMYRTIKHPNVVTAENVAFSCVDPNSVVLVLEKGTPLDAWARAHPIHTSQPLRTHKRERDLLAQHLHIIQGVACGARHLRRNGIVHFDIKPENVLMVGDDAKLFDFGLAEKWPHIRPPHTATERFSGTPNYMPPEELCPATLSRDKSYAADIWAIGVTFFELLFERLPFVNDGPDTAAADMRAVVNTKGVPPQAWITAYVAPRSSCHRVLDEVLREELKRETSRRRRGGGGGGGGGGEEEEENEEEEEEEEKGERVAVARAQHLLESSGSAGGENDVKTWFSESERKRFSDYYGPELFVQLLITVQRMLRWEPTARETDFSLLPSPEPCAVSVQVFAEPEGSERNYRYGAEDDTEEEKKAEEQKTELVPAIFRHVQPLVPDDVYADMINIWHKLRCAHVAARPTVGDVLAIASLASKLANTNDFRKTVERRWKKGEFVGKEHEFVYALDFDLLGPPTCVLSPAAEPTPSAASSSSSSSSSSSTAAPVVGAPGRKARQPKRKPSASPVSAEAAGGGPSRHTRSATVAPRRKRAPPRSPPAPRRARTSPTAEPAAKKTTKGGYALRPRKKKT